MLSNSLLWCWGKHVCNENLWKKIKDQGNEDKRKGRKSVQILYRRFVKKMSRSRNDFLRLPIPNLWYWALVYIFTYDMEGGLIWTFTFKTVWIRFHSFQQKSSVVMDCGLQINKPLVFLTTLMVWRSDLGFIMRWWDLPSGNYFCIFPWFLDSAYSKRCHVIWCDLQLHGRG